MAHLIPAALAILLITVFTPLAAAQVVAGGPCNFNPGYYGYAPTTCGDTTVTCTEISTSYRCDCNIAGYTYDPVRKTCWPANGCVTQNSNLCTQADPNSVCVDRTDDYIAGYGNPGYTCKCKPGYTDVASHRYWNVADCRRNPAVLVSNVTFEAGKVYAGGYYIDGVVAPGPSAKATAVWNSTAAARTGRYGLAITITNTTTVVVKTAAYVTEPGRIYNFCAYLELDPTFPPSTALELYDVLITLKAWRVTSTGWKLLNSRVVMVFLESRFWYVCTSDLQVPDVASVAYTINLNSVGRYFIDDATVAYVLA